MTVAPARAATIAAYIPAPPDPTIRTSVSACIGSWRIPALQVRHNRRLRGFAFARGDLDRLDDLGIGGATAKISREIVADCILVRIRILVEELRGHKYEARRAIAALERARLDEGFLHRTELVAVGEALDCGHLGPIYESGEIKATRDRRSVHQHRAAAAHALAAALARAHQVEIALQQLDEIVVWLDLRGRGLPIESEADGTFCHHASPNGTSAFSRSARNMVSGSSGSSARHTPHASSMALPIAGDTQKVALSPTPFAPNGPFRWCAETASFSMICGRSRMAGIL